MTAINIQVMRGMWNLENPNPEHVDARDIAEGLNNISRFNGVADTVNYRWTVMKHSMLVGRILVIWRQEDAEPYGLLHDAHEFVLGDWMTPIKKLLRKRIGGAFDDVWGDITDAQDSAIYHAFGLEYPVPEKISAQVKSADLMALAIERRDLLPNYGDEYWDLPEPISFIHATDFLHLDARNFMHRLLGACLKIPERARPDDY